VLTFEFTKHAQSEIYESEAVSLWLTEVLKHGRTFCSEGDCHTTPSSIDFRDGYQNDDLAGWR
jgi:hypothetical protein